MDTSFGCEPLTQLSSFVGRTEELVELAQMLPKVRLLTLTGPAGAGKTRLALEFASQQSRSRRYDVVVVRLSPLGDPGAIRRQVLSALDETTDGAETTDRDQLLVLDDCEHVLEACGSLLTTLLPGRPGLRVLATSRESLRLPGEAVFSVTGLPLPDPDSENVLAECHHSEAVTLFIDRARALARDFQLTQTNAPHLSEICTRLDGLPLSIEMAARLIRVFPPAEVRGRLDDQLALLRNGWRLADARHQSLHASLKWGYDLLTPMEQGLLRKLSVLPGGFGPDAAATIAADDPEVAAAVPEILIRLEAKSLIEPVGTGGTARFRILESTRRFGHEQLLAEHEDTDAYERLVAWLTTTCLPLHADSVVPAGTLTRWEEERVNLRHAVQRLAAGADERQLLLVGALAAVETGEVTEQPRTADLVARALTGTAPTSVYRSVALAAAASLARRDAHGEAAARRADEAVELERGRGRSPLLGRLLLLRGMIRLTRDEAEAARTDVREALDIGVRLRQDWLTALCRGMIAGHQVRGGELGEAEREIGRALPVLRRAVPRWLHPVLVTAGSLALEKNDLPAAEAYFAETLRTPAFHWDDTVQAIEGAAVVAARTGRFDRELRLLGAAERMRIGLRGIRQGDAWWRQRVREARDIAYQALPAARATAWLEAGYALSHQQALALALGDEVSGPKTSQPGHPLSRREQDVAALIVEGLTNRQIAARMHVSVRTVETHIRHIRTTLGLRSRAHVAAWSAQQQLDAPAAPPPTDSVTLAAKPLRHRVPEPRRAGMAVRFPSGSTAREVRSTADG
ncbi:ATP-binding protein [Streptomyces sp. NPDC059142]|uniref:ATP-binding protein n=1 Tax=unclassified Streptomyces TaxID=2593676 RepID=UPI0036A807C7